MNLKLPLSLTDNERFHLLRHFSKIDSNYLELFHDNSGFSLKDIRKQIKLSGSNFYNNFAKNPDELFEKIRTRIGKGNFEISHIKNKYEISVNFSKRDYPLGIGIDNILSYASLSKSDKDRIVLKKRGEYHIQILNKTISCPTWTVNLILLRESKKLEILSIFPGKLCPPLPNLRTQNEKTFNSNRKFWSRHVFLINNNTH